MQREIKMITTMSWGKWIVVSFLLFAGFIATLATICMKEDVGLVSSSYYDEELQYQQQMKRMSNASALTQPPVLKAGQNQLLVQYHQLKDIDKGQLKLYRPSDARLDKTFLVPAGSSEEVVFDLGETPRGMYRAKFEWSINGIEYYHEEVIHI
jgi:hypothetical protein